MTPRLFSRRSIFAGKLRALYGPRQNHDTGVPGRYRGPLDRAPEGRLARPPQVVFLSVNLPMWQYDGTRGHPDTSRVSYVQADPLLIMPGFDTVLSFSPFRRLAETYYFYFSGRVRRTRKVYDVQFGGLVYYEDSVTDTPGRTLGSYASGPWENPFGKEYRRVRAAFEEAKKIVEAARPGRTFVAVGRPAEYFKGLPVDYFSHLLAPDLADGFYGTDFLHVHAGMPWTLPVGGTGDFAPIRSSSADTGVAASFDSHRESAFAASIERIKAARPSFPRYGLHLYGLNDTSGLGVPDDVPPPVADYPPPPDMSDFLRDYEDTDLGGTYPCDPPYGPTWPPARPADFGTPGYGSYATCRAWVDTINDHIVPMSADCEQLLQDTADSLEGSGIDVSLIGQTANITGESIAREIAAYYGFDL